VALSILTAPIVVLLAIGSAVSFQAWPLFVEKRLGRDGRPFSCVKLRSLPTNVTVAADKYTIATAVTQCGRCAPLTPTSCPSAGWWSRVV
jgi:lipopolysaccharide/colanic/teichoic acid biosynthesis glycosyltransferase